MIKRRTKTSLSQAPHDCTAAAAGGAEASQEQKVTRHNSTCLKETSFCTFIMETNSMTYPLLNTGVRFELAYEWKRILLSKRWKSKYSRKEIMPGSCPIQFCSSSEVPLFSSISPGALILLHTVQSSTWLLHNTLYQRTLGLSPSPSSCYGHYGDSVSLSGRQVWDIPQDRCTGITPVFF